MLLALFDNMAQTFGNRFQLISSARNDDAMLSAEWFVAHRSGCVDNTADLSWNFSSMMCTVMVK